MVFMSKVYVHTTINIRELLAAAPALPGVYETSNFRGKQGGNVEAPNLSPCTKLKAEKVKFCWVKPRAKPGRALQGTSSATRGCQEASVACVWQSLTKIHPCLVLGARVGGTGDAPPVAGSWAKSSLTGAVRGWARARGLPSFSAISWEPCKATLRHQNLPCICLRCKLHGALLPSLPEIYKEEG